MEIRRILVTGRLYDELAAFLPDKRPDKEYRFVAEEELKADDFAWADAYIGFRPAGPFSLAHLRWVHSLGAGVDAFLWKRKWKPDVLLTRTIGAFGEQIAEYCLSYLLRDAQCHDVYAWYQEQRQWKPVAPKRLSEQRMVIYGTGEIGRRIAETLRLFGVSPVGVSRSGRDTPPFSAVYRHDEAGEALARADWVIATLPLTEETHHLFDKTFFSCLHNAGFINVGRGATVEEAALVGALENRNVRLAVLDVFEEEPLPPHSPLWGHPHVIITPHIAALTSAEDAAHSILDTLRCIETGEPLANAVDVSRQY
ncbi:D-2-hydroxyacid dehydrogenase [Caldibacillus thermoamylovorans]